MLVFWFVTLYVLVSRYQRSGGTYCFHLHGFSLKRYNPEDHPHTLTYYIISTFASTALMATLKDFLMVTALQKYNISPLESMLRTFRPLRPQTNTQYGKSRTDFYFDSTRHVHFSFLAINNETLINFIRHYTANNLYVT
jgi:hypothetical protein